MERHIIFSFSRELLGRYKRMYMHTASAVSMHNKYREI